jgi:hypothetical protein
MILKSLKSNQPFFILFIPLISIGLWIYSFLNPKLYSFYQGENSMILYQPIQFLLENRPLMSVISAFVFMLLLAFLILKLNYQYAFIKTRSFLPSVLFILIASGIHMMQTMHPIYPAALFLILSVDRIFATYDKEVIHSNAFDSGIYLAIGSLFYLNLVFFFPFLWIGFIVLKPKVNWREYILTTLGFLLPWILALAYYVASNRMEELVQTLTANISTSQLYLRDNLPIQIFIGFLGLLTIISSIFILGQYDGKKISSRKYFKAFFWVFLFAGIQLLANPVVSQEIIIIHAIPLTFLISNYLIFMRRTVWGEIFIYILIAGVIYLQFV